LLVREWSIWGSSGAGWLCAVLRVLVDVIVDEDL